MLWYFYLLSYGVLCYYKYWIVDYWIMIGFYLILLGKLLSFKLFNFNLSGSEYPRYPPAIRADDIRFIYIFLTDSDPDPNMKISMRIRIRMHLVVPRIQICIFSGSRSTFKYENINVDSNLINLNPNFTISRHVILKFKY